jgi:acetyl-CoA carboxylase beta subunit
MRKRRLILIQGDNDLKQTYFICDRCGAEMTSDASKGDTLLFWKGQFVRVIQNIEPTDPRLFR